MSKGPAPIVGTVTIPFEGREITASYSVGAGMVTVHCVNGDETTQLGGSSAESLARLLLFELAKNGKA
jgi:hypothetical protein